MPLYQRHQMKPFQKTGPLASEAARIIGVSATRVRQLDAVLRPQILASGVRVYDLSRVEAFARQRAERAKARHDAAVERMETAAAKAGAAK
jgi:hypothetical protein